MKILLILGFRNGIFNTLYFSICVAFFKIICQNRDETVFRGDITSNLPTRYSDLLNLEHNHAKPSQVMQISSSSYLHNLNNLPGKYPNWLPGGSSSISSSTTIQPLAQFYYCRHGAGNLAD